MEKASLAAVTVIGGDRPGIVSAVTRVPFQLGCNLQDATSTILSGHFAMMLIVGLPQDVDPARIEARPGRPADQHRQAGSSSIRSPHCPPMCSAGRPTADLVCIHAQECIKLHDATLGGSARRIGIRWGRAPPASVASR